jgi:hypothetical protein
MRDWTEKDMRDFLFNKFFSEDEVDILICSVITSALRIIENEREKAAQAEDELSEYLAKKYWTDISRSRDDKVQDLTARLETAREINESNDRRLASLLAKHHDMRKFLVWLGSQINATLEDDDEK